MVAVELLGVLVLALLDLCDVAFDRQHPVSELPDVVRWDDRRRQLNRNIEGEESERAADLQRVFCGDWAGVEDRADC